MINVNEIPEELLDLLKQVGPDHSHDLDFYQQLNRWRVQLNVKFKESSGIDLIDSGEWIRREMYQHIIDNDVVNGLDLLSHVRSFDFNFYRPGLFSSKITYDHKKSIHLDEYLWAKEVASKPLKTCITSFNTIAEWSYTGKHSFEELMFDLIDEVYIPETKKLLDNGVGWLQMDEPALTTHPRNADIFVDGWNYWIDRIKSHIKPQTVISLHNCFSNYSFLWPILPSLNNLGALSLEFANRDTWALGRDPRSRKAYSEVEKNIRVLYKEETGFEVKIALGIIPVHTDHLTSPELIRDRLLYINTLIEDARFILCAPDCGLRQRSLDVAHQLLKNITLGADLARKSIH